MSSTNRQNRWQWRHLSYAVLLLIEGLLFFAVCFPAVEINQFFVRDILRTQEILSGHFIAVGPDFTSGSYAPGPFYYFILAPIVIFTQQAWIILIYLFALKTLIQFFFCRALKKTFSISFFYFYLLLSASPILIRAFYWPNNATLIIPLGQLLGMLALWYYQAPLKQQTRWLVVMAIFWGLTLQVHFSLILAGPLLLFTIGERNRSAQGRLKDTGYFFICVLVSFAPFLNAFYNAHALTNFDGPVFYVNDFGFSFFFKYWGLQVGRTFTSPPQPDQPIVFTWLIFSYTLLKGLWILFSKRVTERNVSERFFLLLTGLTLLMSAWFLLGRVTRYYAILYSLSSIFIMLDIHQVLIRYFKSSKVGFCIAGLIFVLSWYSVYDFHKYLGLKGRCENCLLQTKKICDYMNEHEVSYQDFVSSTYELLEEFNEGSAALTQECFQLKAEMSSKEKKRYLIVHASYLERKTLPAALAALPVEIRNVYQEDRLKLELTTEGFSLYSVSLKGSELAHYGRLTNLTFFYDIDPAFGETYYLSRFRANNKRLSKSQICPTPLFCDLFVLEDFHEGVLTLEFHARVFQTKYDLDPIAGRAQGLKLNYLCDGKPKVLDVISTLGASNGKDQMYSFFTPLVASFEVPCKGVQLQSFKVDKFDLFYTKIGLDHLVNQEYEITSLDP